MNFSQALEKIKAGSMVTRLSWGGDSDYCFLVNEEEFIIVEDFPLLMLLEHGSTVTYKPRIDRHYSDGSVGAWVPTIDDLMAEDWDEL